MRAFGRQFIVMAALAGLSGAAAAGPVAGAGTGDPTTVMPEAVNPAEMYLIAAAGNGAGAKCSDELGRMAAAIALEKTEVFQ